MQGILLLNASFEPLRVVPLRRAVILLLDEKAEIVETAEGELRSAERSMPVPSVIRLTTYVRVPYRGKLPLTRKSLLDRDKRTCQYCKKPGDTIDHVHPRSKGGKHEWENVVIACLKCNHKKADKLLKDIGWSLDRAPVAPKGVRWLTVAIGAPDPSWAPYLGAEESALVSA